MILWEQKVSMTARGDWTSTWKYDKSRKSGKVLLAQNVPALCAAGCWRSISFSFSSRLAFDLPESDTGL